MPLTGQGWELHIIRLGLQTRGAYTRTYGSYQAFLNGTPIDGLTGNVCECPGPGENNIPNTDKRIREGRYPLYTQFGERYRTIGFTSDVNTSAGTAPIPMPGVLVGKTDQRNGIVIHPGHPPDLYLSSVGCINLTKPLLASDNMLFLESRNRIIALIDALRMCAPTAFEEERSTTIGATLVIDGEPMKPLPDAIA